ncbi:hypothetical protein D3C76_1214050 [compost metagenome]
MSGYLQYLGLLAVGEHVAAGHIHLGEDLVDLGQVQAAGRGQLQAPADAQEQVVAQHVFKLRHLLADRALGQVQLFGGTGKAQMAGCSFEALQGSHGGHQAFGHSGLCGSNHYLTE